MRFLVDQNLSPRLADLLVAARHDAVHTRELGLQRAPDDVVLDRAASERRVLVSSDTDFAALLAGGHRREPSLILFRRERPRRAADQAALLLVNLERFDTALAEGAIVVIEEHRIRIRALPLIPE